MELVKTPADCRVGVWTLMQWSPGKGWRLHAATNIQWFDLVSSRVSEHPEVLGGRCIQKAWTSWLTFICWPTHHFPQLLLSCILDHKLVNVSRVFSWILWSSLTNYWTPAGGHRNNARSASLGSAWEVWADLRNHALTLWNLRLTPGMSDLKWTGRWKRSIWKGPVHSILFLEFQGHVSA